jgi:hypothetical protein
MSYATERKMDRLQNEGGEGYSHAEALASKNAAATLAEIEKEMAEKFAAEWTVEVTAARRATWNTEAVKCKTIAQVGALQRKLGFGLDSLKKAIALHSL